MSTSAANAPRRPATSLYCYKKVRILGLAPSAAGSTDKDAEKGDENMRFYQNVRDTVCAAFKANQLHFPDDDRLRIYYRDCNGVYYVSPGAPVSKERLDKDTTVYRFEKIETGLLSKIYKKGSRDCHHVVGYFVDVLLCFPSLSNVLVRTPTMCSHCSWHILSLSGFPQTRHA